MGSSFFLKTRGRFSYVRQSGLAHRSQVPFELEATPRYYGLNAMDLFVERHSMVRRDGEPRRVVKASKPNLAQGWAFSSLIPFWSSVTHDDGEREDASGSVDQNGEFGRGIGRRMGRPRDPPRPARNGLRGREPLSAGGRRRRPGWEISGEGLAEIDGRVEFL